MLTCDAVLRAGAIAVLLIAGDASANPASNVPSAADPGDPADLHLHVDYEYSVQSSVLYREAVGDAVDPLSPIPRHRDLAFHQFRHLVTPSFELGVYRDTWLSWALPITIAQVRELELADGVSRTASSTVRDGLLPAEGFDAQDPGTPPPGDFMFRSQKRSGVDQMHFGLNVAPMNQQRDDTKPTWKLGAELRLAIGRVARFNRMDPTHRTAVGRGVHDLRLWTSVAKRTRYVEGWFDMFWQAPIAAKEASLFDDDPGFGAKNTMPGQKAGASAGLELIAIDDTLTQNRISLDVGGRVVAHFEGRDYTELWEVFTYAGDSRFGGPLVLESDPVNPDPQPMSHPGISNHEGYLETAGRMAVSAQLGPHVQFSAVVDLVWKTDHLISFADAGIELPTCGTGSTPCEDADNVVVNPGTREVNPLHAPRIDLAGHRYTSEDNFDFVLGVEARVLY